jgi:hypothetical protein
MNMEIADMLLEMETRNSISTTGRLDFRQPAQSGNPTIFASVAAQSAGETGAPESQYFCKSRKTLVRVFAQIQQRCKRLPCLVSLSALLIVHRYNSW